MLYYLKADMEDINTMTSFSMLKLVITQIGIEGIPGILEPWSMIQRTFSLYPYGISRGECEICARCWKEVYIRNYLCGSRNICF